MRGEWTNEAALVAVYHQQRSYTIAHRLVTNSQDALWHFLQAVEKIPKCRPEGPPYFDADKMAGVYQAHTRLKNQNFATIDLVDIGIFGFVLLYAPGDLAQVFDKFFGGEFRRVGELPEAVREIF